MRSIPETSNVATIAVAAAVFVGSSVPLPTASQAGSASIVGVAGVTTLCHFVGYGCLAALLARRGARSAAVVGAVVAATGYGFGIEVIQAFLPWRSFDAADAVVNGLGAVVGASISRVRPFGADSTNAD